MAVNNKHLTWHLQSVATFRYAGLCPAGIILRSSVFSVGCQVVALTYTSGLIYLLLIVFCTVISTIDRLCPRTLPTVEDTKFGVDSL